MKKHLLVDLDRTVIDTEKTLQELTGIFLPEYPFIKHEFDIRNGEMWGIVNPTEEEQKAINAISIRYAVNPIIREDFMDVLPTLLNNYYVQFCTARGDFHNHILSGEAATEYMLNRNGLGNIPISYVQGYKTDYITKHFQMSTWILVDDDIRYLGKYDRNNLYSTGKFYLMNDSVNMDVIMSDRMNDFRIADWYAFLEREGLSKEEDD